MNDITKCYISIPLSCALVVVVVVMLTFDRFVGFDSDESHHDLGS